MATEADLLESECESNITEKRARDHLEGGFESAFPIAGNTFQEGTENTMPVDTSTSPEVEVAALTQLNQGHLIMEEDVNSHEVPESPDATSSALNQSGFDVESAAVYHESQGDFEVQVITANEDSETRLENTDLSQHLNTANLEQFAVPPDPQVEDAAREANVGPAIQSAMLVDAITDNMAGSALMDILNDSAIATRDLEMNQDLKIDQSARIRSPRALGSYESDLASLLDLSTLQSTIDSETLSELDEMTKSAIKLLKVLVTQFAICQASDLDPEQFLSQIRAVEQLSKPEQTIIGVLGPTGCGKTSLINSLLGEERLLPTSCIRASTAVVTRIAYNDDNDEGTRYRAQIEFITARDWKSELTVLCGDIITEGKNITREAKVVDSLAGQAYAKIKAVYPISDAELTRSSVADLMDEPAVTAVLGHTETVSSSGSSDFYNKLSQYLDSGEKILSKSATQAFQFWPLIKEVRIYTKADFLLTGATIVDLPGVHDSNAARSAIAKSYMKNCTAFWVATPANRALDDQSAHDLLDDALERQLRLDNKLQDITIICTKTDEISVEDAPKSLGIYSEIQNLRQKLLQDSRTEKRLSTDLSALSTDVTNQSQRFQDSYVETMIWQKLEKSAMAGESVYAPTPPSNKRRQDLNVKDNTSRKRRFGASSKVVENADAISTPQTLQTDLSRGATQLTMKDITDKLVGLEDIRSSAMNAKDDAQQRFDATNDELIAVVDRREAIHDEIHDMCIKRRNEYFAAAIKQKFSQANSDRTREEAKSVPTAFEKTCHVDLQELPVFCISSRAFQILSGHLELEQAPRGFLNLEDTQIPQLQAHGQKLAGDRRLASHRMFLTEMHRLITSLLIWASPGDADGKYIVLSAEEIKLTEAFVEAELNKMKVAFDVVINSFNTSLQVILKSLLTELNKSIQGAVVQANLTVERWNSPPCPAFPLQGGYAWPTYRALVRRNGIFTNAKGSHDWNAELMKPLQQGITDTWTKSFSRILPEKLEALAKSLSHVLESFHQAVKDGACHNAYHASNSVLFPQLDQQVVNYTVLFKSHADRLATVIEEKQRSASRMFAAVIEEKLAPSYKWCYAQEGQGFLERVKKCMRDIIQSEGKRILAASCKLVKKHLRMAFTAAQSEVRDQQDETFNKIKRDWIGNLTGKNSQGSELSEQELFLKGNVRRLLSGEELLVFKPQPRVKKEPIE